MTYIFLITVAISLIYIGLANRLYTYISVLAIQGLLLFGIAFIELIEINTLNLIFVLLETIVIKAIAIPLFLKYVIKKNNITREAEPYVSNFVSVVIVTAIILGSFLLSNAINDEKLQKMFFVIALSCVFTGLYIIVSRKKIITHLMGFLIIENGVFILSLAVGSDMPMLVNTGILLDIFVSILLLGIFINKLGGVLKQHEVSQLKNLQD